MLLIGACHKTVSLFHVCSWLPLSVHDWLFFPVANAYNQANSSLAIQVFQTSPNQLSKTWNWHSCPIFVSTLKCTPSPYLFLIGHSKMDVDFSFQIFHWLFEIMNQTKVIVWQLLTILKKWTTFSIFKLHLDDWCGLSMTDVDCQFLVFDNWFWDVWNLWIAKLVFARL